MGGVGFSDVVNTVVGVGGAVSSWSAASSQQEYLNQQMEMGNKQRGLVAGLDEYFLGGGKASRLNVPGFQQQFGQLDTAAQEQIRQLDSQAEKSRRMIADNIPDGGAKLRALADLSMRVQDERGKIVRETQAKKSDLDVQLTNQYLQQAMGRQVGPSQDARMYAALGDYRERQADLQALGGAIGTLGDKMFQSGGESQGVEYVPQQEQSAAATGPAAYWGQPSKSSTLEDPYKNTDDLARQAVMKEASKSLY